MPLVSVPATDKPTLKHACPIYGGNAQINYWVPDPRAQMLAHFCLAGLDIQVACAVEATHGEQEFTGRYHPWMVGSHHIKIWGHLIVGQMYYNMATRPVGFIPAAEPEAYHDKWRQRFRLYLRADRMPHWKQMPDGWLIDNQVLNVKIPGAAVGEHVLWSCDLHAVELASFDVVFDQKLPFEEADVGRKFHPVSYVGSSATALPIIYKGVYHDESDHWVSPI